MFNLISHFLDKNFFNKNRKHVTFNEQIETRRELERLTLIKSNLGHQNEPAVEVEL
jgi:hypothetical protein